MGFELNPINVINAALCITIFILGYMGYRDGRDTLPLFIGIAFGMFGFSHIMTILGFGVSLMNFLVTIRVIAYLIVVVTLYRLAFRR